MKTWLYPVILGLLASGANARAQDIADGWITHPAARPEQNPVVLKLRRAVDLRAKPGRYVVRVTADNRFILYVNGRRIAAGPSTGDIAHWREESIDLAPYLKSGRNVVAAVIWNGVRSPRLSGDLTPQQVRAEKARVERSQTAPHFQQSVATGFRLMGEGNAEPISTNRSGWRIQRDEGHTFVNGAAQLKQKWFYVAGQPEIIDASKSNFDWAGAMERGMGEGGAGWTDALAAPEAAKRTLVPDRLPPQIYAPVAPGVVIRSDLRGGLGFPAHSIEVPANSDVKLLHRRDAMVAAYPQLDVSGGRGATIKITWSEALYDAALKKGDRNLVEDRKPFGIYDTFLPDGRQRTFAPLWWRTWRHAEIAVQTKDQPLVLRGMRAFETGYPFQQIGQFKSDDPALTRIFDIGWRTARIDAHETYMDTAYWEQLQYVGDTRLQILISFAMSGDARLGEQAIDMLAASNYEGGLMDGAYPERSPNVIATFGLLWVGMLDDWRRYQPDRAPIVRNLARMREILDWFSLLQQPSGLLRKNPQWNFIDWVGTPAQSRTRFPSYGKTNESCLMSALWLGALQQGARIEAELGDKTPSLTYAAKAASVKQAIRTRSWVPAKQLFADNPDGDLFSQHMNSLAVLYDVASPQEAGPILDRIVAPGKGIDAPEVISTTSYYFAWYLAQAFSHAGRSDRYLGLLDTWRDLLKLNYTTWPEERGDTRSDTHAWSAHPTADLLGLVAGIGPSASGYKTLRIAPALGNLKRLDATAATPSGPVRVRYQVRGKDLVADVARPSSLPGTFEWQGKTYPLVRPQSRIVVPLP